MAPCAAMAMAMIVIVVVVVVVVVIMPLDQLMSMMAPISLLNRVGVPDTWRRNRNRQQDCRLQHGRRVSPR
jgi:hypothetical protein